MQSISKDLLRWVCSQREATAQGRQCDKTLGRTHHPSVTVMASLLSSVNRVQVGETTLPWQCVEMKLILQKEQMSMYICNLGLYQQVCKMCLSENTKAIPYCECGLYFKTSNIGGQERQMMFNFIGIQDLATNLGIYLFVSMQSYMCVLMLD